MIFVVAMSEAQQLDAEIAELESKIDGLRRQLAAKQTLRETLRGPAGPEAGAVATGVNLVQVVDGLLLQLRTVFRRRATFRLFVVVVWGFLLRLEGAGVTSLVRCFGLAPRQYHNLLGFFHSSAFSVIDLCKRWAELIVAQSRACLLLAGKPLYLVDAIKVAKEGRKMPGVKVLHQESESNSKPEFIRGHFWGALSVLIGNAKLPYALPLRFSLQDGIKQSPSVRETLVEKMAAMIIATAPRVGVVVADAYYAAQSFLTALVAAGFHVITRLRSNAVAYQPAKALTGKRGRGRPKKYGKKVHLAALFRQPGRFRKTDLALYGDIKNITFLSLDLLWRGLLVRIVLTVYPNGARRILLGTDLTMLPEAIIQTYGFRFKIEVQFRQLVHTLRGFFYHFWLMAMPKQGRNPRTQYLHRKPRRYVGAVMRKIEAYERFVNIGAIALGLLQLLAILHPSAIWRCLPVWQRTKPRHGCPSENVVRLTLQSQLAAGFSGLDEPPPLLQEMLAGRTETASIRHPLRIIA